MFEGAPATRKLASVVLMNNSFADLPGGVELADTIITNLQLNVNEHLSEVAMSNWLRDILAHKAIYLNFDELRKN